MAHESCELDKVHMDENRCNDIFTNVTTSPPTNHNRIVSNEKEAKEYLYIDSPQAYYTSPSPPPPYASQIKDNSYGDHLLPVKHPKCKWIVVAIVFAVLLSIAAIITVSVLFTRKADTETEDPKITTNIPPHSGQKSSSVRADPSTTQKLHPTTTRYIGGTNDPSLSVNTSQLSTGTPSSTPTTTVAVSPTTAFAGQWSLWTEWGSCDKTCGPGNYIRSRSCLRETCIGTSIQQDDCFVDDCPSIAESLGTWTTWGPWESCSSSCGDGTQSRARVCNTEPEQETCIGNAAQTRGCNDGQCPDCSIACSNGNYNCLKCICPGNTVSGKVLTELGTPIQYVKVSYSGFGHTALAITSNTGEFAIQDACQSDELLFSKDGYIDTTSTLSQSNNIVRLHKIKHLYMAKEPLSVAVMVGGCAHLACEAEGSPGPNYYEWFHDDILVIGATTQNLTILDTTKEKAGTYKCRASNDYSAVFSRDATVTVEEQESEICDAVPRERLIELPYGCEINGEDMIDVGMCSPTKCALSLEGSGSCYDTQQHSACGATRYTQQMIQCVNYQIPVDIVAECGCLRQPALKRILRGTVLAVGSEAGVPFAAIAINGIAQTISNFYGEFAVELPLSLSRVVVDVTANTYFSYSKTISVNEDESELYHVCYLKSKPAPMKFSSSDEAVLSLSGDGFDMAASLTVPPNAFFDENGNEYNGQVYAFIDTYDPRDSFNMENAPGDFTTLDAEGEPVFLESGGMFRLEFTDPTGNTLNIGANVSISLTLNTTDIESAQNMQLWTLNTVGRWEHLSDLKVESSATSRRKRQIDGNTRGLTVYSDNIPGVVVTREWSNFDYIKRLMCYSKVRLYEHDILVNTHSAFAKVQVVSLMGTGSSVNTVSSFRPTGDTRNGYGEQCIAHPCDTTRSSGFYNYEGYIIARDSQNNFFKPVPDSDLQNDYNFQIVGDKIKTDLNNQKSNNGPFYDYGGRSASWRYSSKCTGASSNEKAFTFYKTKLPECKSKETPPVTSDLPNQTKPHIFYYSSKFDNTLYQVCFMRVKITTNVPKIILTTRSYSQNSADPPSPDDFYGLRQECIKTDKTEYGCVEYKAPGKVFYSDGSLANEKTRVKVDLEGQYGITSVVHQLASTNHVVNINSNKVDVMLDYHPTNTHVEEFEGRVCETRDLNAGFNINSVKQLARNRCKQLSDPDYWAFHFK